MLLLDAQGQPVQTGTILHGARGRYVLLGHDDRQINIQSADERRVYAWTDPHRFGLRLVEDKVVNVPYKVVKRKE